MKNPKTSTYNRLELENIRISTDYAQKLSPDTDTECVIGISTSTLATQKPKTRDCSARIVLNKSSLCDHTRKQPQSQLPRDVVGNQA